MRRNPISVRVKRKEIFPGGIKGVEPAVRHGAIDGLRAIGLAMLSTAKQKIQKGPASGRVYQKYNPRRIHQASAEGEAPATDTGALVNSGFQELDEGALEVHVGFAKLYAIFLEFGTRMIGKRPFMLPTVEEWRKKITGIIGKAIRARLK